MKKILILFSLLIISTSAFSQQRFSLKPNEWHTIDSTFQFKVNNVLEDSRCPADSHCIWAGRVIVEIEFKLNDQSDKLGFGPSHGIGDTITIKELPFSNEVRKKNFVEGFIWQDKTYHLVNVSPYPGKKEPKAYVFEIK